MSGVHEWEQRMCRGGAGIGDYCRVGLCLRTPGLSLDIYLLRAVCSKQNQLRVPKCVPTMRGVMTTLFSVVCPCLVLEVCLLSDSTSF